MLRMGVMKTDLNTVSPKLHCFLPGQALVDAEYQHFVYEGPVYYANQIKHRVRPVGHDKGSIFEVFSLNDYSISEVETITNVVALVVHREHCLMVSTKGDDGSLYFGFPGGKMEGGETKHRAVSRELYEETGLFGVPTGASFTGQCDGSTCKAFAMAVSDFNVIWRLNNEEEGFLTWVPLDQVVEISNPRYREYNSQVVEFIKSGCKM